MDEHEALGIGDNLGGIEGLLEVIDELLSVSSELRCGSLELSAGTDTFVLEGAQATSKHGLADKGDRYSEIESVYGGPLASSLLASGIEDLFQDWRSIAVLVAEDIASNFDEEGVQNALVPLLENVSHLFLRHSQTALHDIISLHK